MASFEFDIGDDYDKKCGEMFLTLKGNIIFHCTLCENKYETFEHYADHVLLHYIKTSNIKETITDHVQPAQLNDDNRELAPKWRKNKPPPISELMTKLFENDTILPDEAPTIKQEPIDEILPEPKVIQSQTNDASPNIEAFDIKVEFSDTEFFDNETTTESSAMNPSHYDNINYFYECSQCNEVFQTPKSLDDHQSQQHRIANVQLKNSYLKKKGKASKKLVKETQNNIFVCKYCGKGCPTWSELQAHNDYYNNENNTKCTFCQMVFENSVIMHRHISVHLNERHYECDICKARFKKQRGLIEHGNVHKYQERTFACKMCDQKFQLKAGLKWHVRTKHSKNTNNTHGFIEFMEDGLGTYVDVMTSAALV